MTRWGIKIPSFDLSFPVPFRAVPFHYAIFAIISPFRSLFSLLCSLWFLVHNTTSSNTILIFRLAEKPTTLPRPVGVGGERSLGPPRVAKRPNRPTANVPTRNLGFVRAGGPLIGSTAANEVLPQRTDQWQKVMPHLDRKDLLDFNLVLD